MATKWLVEARKIKQCAVKNKSPQVFMQPIYRGKALRLQYNDMKLSIRGLTKGTIAMLRKSGVPRFLNTKEYPRWGGLTPKVLYIHGVVVRSRKDAKKRRFIPVYVCGEDGIEYHNQLTSLHLLFTRGFFTTLTQGSWMHTSEVNPSTLKKRLAVKATLRVETRNGKSFSPCEPKGLELFDCMAFEPPKTKGKK